MDENGEVEKTVMLSRSAAHAAIERIPKHRLMCVNITSLEDPSGKQIELDGESLQIGRGSENTVTVKGEGLSRVHARLFKSGNIWGVEDLGSTNGVKVNGTKVPKTFLKEGDVVEFGQVAYKYVVESGSAPAAAPADEAGVDVTGAAEKTMIMSPSAIKQAAANPQDESLVETQAAKAVRNPANHAAPSEGSGGMLKVAIIVGVVVVAAAAFFALG